MARQSRKGKNELDLILEQLKQSYGSEASESVEDDLLKTAPSDEDAELNDLLNKLFDENESNTDEEPDSKVTEANENLSESAAVEVDVSASIDADNKDESSSDGSSDDTAKENTIQICDDTEDADIDSQKITESSDNCEDDSAEAVQADIIPVAISDDNAIHTDREESDQVDHVLDLMFNHRSIISDANDTDEASYTEDETAYAQDTDNINTEYINEESEDLDYLFNDNTSDVYYDDDEENVSFDMLLDDLYEDTEKDSLSDNSNYQGISLDDDDIFAVKDEEYDISDPDISQNDLDIPTIDYSYGQKALDSTPILSPDKYVHDPLQSSTPSFNLSGYDSYMNEDAEDSEGSLNYSLSDNTSFDYNDISLLLKLGYDHEIKAKVGKEKAQEVMVEYENNYQPEKYKKPFGYCGNELTNRGQISKIKEKYKINKLNTIILLTVVSVLSALLLATDIFYLFFSAKIEFFPIALALEFIFITLIYLILYRKTLSGISKMLKFEPDNSSLLAFIGLVYLIYLASALFVYLNKYPALNANELNLFGFALSIYALSDTVSDLLNCIREASAFGIIESSDKVFVAEKQKRSAKIEFGSESITDNTYRIQKSELVSGYFKKNSTPPAANINFIFEFGIMPTIALVVGCVVTLLGGSVMAGLSMMMMSMMLGIPFSSIFIFSLYEFILAKQLLKSQTSFIGYAAAEEYAKADTIIFDDNEAIKITSFVEIVPGKELNHQKSLDTAFDVFKTLGGPLSKACEPRSKSISHGNRPMMINEISENGIDLYYNNSTNILIGDKYYMKAHKIKVKTDTNLSTAVKGLDRSVIFMAFDGVPKLGFIINSKIRKDFISIVDVLGKLNINSIIETFEPQINDIYFEQNMTYGEPSVKVLKPSDFESSQPSKICSSGIVSSSSSINVAKTISMCGDISKNRNRFRLINRTVMICGLSLAIIMSVLYCLGIYHEISSAILGQAVTVFYALTFAETIPSIIKLILIHYNYAKKKKTENQTKNE